MGVFDSDIQTAIELIAENGEDSEYIQLTPAADGGKPWRPADYQSSGPVPTVRAVWLNYKLHTSGSGNDPGTLIKQGDKKVLIAAGPVGFDISATDQLRRADGSLWQIVNVKLLDPNGQRILYEVQARQ